MNETVRSPLTGDGEIDTLAGSESENRTEADVAPQPEDRRLAQIRNRFDSPPYRLVKNYGPPLALVTLLSIIWFINHFSGQDWGDDFALYLRQAKALTIGNIGEVISDNRFTLDNSGWNTFSPHAYPWGWPLIVAPLYAVFGLNYAVFKAVEVLALGLFLLAFFAVVKKRTNRLVATLLLLLIGLSPLYVGGTGTVLSDIPYLCFVGLSFWWMDRCRLQGLIGNVSRNQYVVMGLLLAYSFNIRREGIVLLFAFAALHVSALAGAAIRSRSANAFRELDWRRASVPYVTFGLAVTIFHLLLPTMLFQRVPGTGLQNVSVRLAYYQDILAQHVGLKDPGSPTQLFGSEGLGERALLTLLVLAGIGLVLRLRYRWEEDIAIATFLGFSILLMLIYPAHEPRYLYAVTPFLAYFAVQALPTLADIISPGTRRLGRVAYVAPALALLGLVTLNAWDTARSTQYHLDYSLVVEGPETPAAQEMFATVQSVTRADDVILFFRSRAMIFYTDRRAVMGVNLEQLLPRSDWYVMAKGSTYSQKLLTDDEAASYGLTKTWENEAWVMWRVPEVPLTPAPG